MPGIVIQIQGDGSGAAEALRMIEERMKQTAETAHETGDAFEVLDERIEKGVEYAGIYMGLHEAIDAVKELIGGSIDLGMELGHISQQTGISAQNLSVLKVASDDTGISFDSLVKGFKKLSTSLLEYQENSRTTVDAFKLLNISQEDLAATNGDVYKVMELVADRMSQMPDGWKKNAAAVQLFGRAGQDLIPILNEGSAGVEKFRSEAEAMGVVLDQESVQKMEELHAEAAQAKGAIDGLGLALTSALTPALQDFSRGASTAIEYLQKLLDLKDKVSTTGLLNNIPDEIVGASDPDDMAKRDYGKRDIANAQIAHLEELYSRRLISQKEYNGRRLALQREAASESLKASQAEIVATEDQLTDAQVKLNKDTANTSVLDKILGTDTNIQADKDEIDGINRSLEFLAKNARDAQDKLASLDKRNDVGPPTSTHKKHVRDQDEISARSGNLVDREAQKELRQLDEAADAKLRLTEALDRASELKAASHSGAMLQILEAQHAAGLKTDAEFYDAKRTLEEKMFSVEKTALEQEQHDLQSAIGAAPAGSQKGYELQAQLVSISTRLAELADRRKAAEESITAELQRQQKLQEYQMDPAVAAKLKQHKDQQAEMARDSANTVAKMLGQITNLRGSDPLKQMADSMISDIERLALKLIEEKWILPMLQSMFGVSPATSPLQTSSPTLTTMIPSVPGFAAGGDPTGLSIVGEKGPELFMPKGPGTILPNDALTKISQSSGGDSHGPNVTVNVSNQSSQPVTMRQTGMSYDAQARQFVLHTVLEDMNSGGPMSQAMKGFGGG